MTLTEMAQYAAVISLGIAFITFVINNWGTFRRLRDSIVPVFLVLTIIALLFSWLYPRYHSPQGISLETAQGGWKSTARTPVVGKTFRNEVVPVDGHSYSACTFENVTLLYKGEAPFDFAHNTFNGTVTLRLETGPLYAVALLFREFKLLKDGAPVRIGPE
jgi:hypothetical protein